MLANDSFVFKTGAATVVGPRGYSISGGGGSGPQETLSLNFAKSGGEVGLKELTLVHEQVDRMPGDDDEDAIVIMFGAMPVEYG